MTSQRSKQDHPHTAPEPLRGPRDADDARRMEEQAREAERHIADVHEEADPDDNPIYEE